MDFNKLIFTENDCYKVGRPMTPVGIVVHSTGTNNTSLRRYVNPDDGRLGRNKYGNHWNRSGVAKCVHAFIGKDKDGKVCTYQTLPLDIACWGCGKGSKGSYNGYYRVNNIWYYSIPYLQFEICEDNLKDATYFKQVMREAQELCAMWCKEFNIPIEDVVSHKEARTRGYASNHGDIDHWLKKFGMTMDDFRNRVKAFIDGVDPDENTFEPYSVKVTTSKLYIRKGPGTNYAKAGSITDKGTYVIVEEADGKGATKWGRLESGEGWISLDYTEKVEAFRPYSVQVTTSKLYIRKGPGTNYAKAGSITDRGRYVIVAESDGKGATKWGKLESGEGWISLDYTTFVEYV